MEFEGATGFNHALHYGKTLVCKMINTRFTLAYTDGASFYDYTTNRMLATNIIREVMVLTETVSEEPFTANIKHVKRDGMASQTQPGMAVTADEILPDDSSDGPGMFDLSANDHQKRKSSGNTHNGKPYQDKLPF
jgi:hypothetical protein